MNTRKSKIIPILPSRVTVEGLDRLDPRASYVFTGNHISNIDIPVMVGRLPVSVRFLAKKELFKVPLLAPAMRAVGIVEVDRDARSAIHTQVNTQSKAVLSLGRSLIIYPEGTRSPSGEPQAFKAGIGLLASELRVPVVPMWLEGLRAVLPKGASRPQRGPVRVRIGEPLRVQPGADYGNVTACLEQSLARLRDVTRPPV